MKNITQTNQRRGKSAEYRGNPLEIRVLTKEELPRFREFEGKYHYMGEGHGSGDTMRFIVTLSGEWIALLHWSSASYCLKARDEYIGWSAQQRAKRQKLIVQNRRFVMLSEPGENRNLASKILALMNRTLPDFWYDRFGYKPLLAETFCDIEARAGTCYKASGWIPLGYTKGYSRHQADFYIPNDRPKKLWVYPLCKEAPEKLRAQSLPKECLKGAQSDDGGVLPLKVKQIESLYDVFYRFKDPRSKNSIYPIGAMLSIIAMAILSGHRNIVQIARFAKRMKMNHRKMLGLPRFAKGSKYFKHPSYNAFYNLLKKLDADLFAQTLSEWLFKHSGTLPAGLAMDGKFIKNTVGLVCLCDHETGVPQAMAIASKKEGEGEKCEMKSSQKLIAQIPSLAGKEITSDALNTQKITAQLICAKGGDYTFQVKNNQPTVMKNVQLKTEKLSPFLNK